MVCEISGYFPNSLISFHRLLCYIDFLGSLYNKQWRVKTNALYIFVYFCYVWLYVATGIFKEPMELGAVDTSYYLCVGVLNSCLTPLGNV